MTLIKTCNKEQAYKDIINTWLRANPDNMRYCKVIIEQNKRRRGLQYSVYGASKTNPNDFRVGLSIPTGLYYTFVQFERKWGREFMAKKEDMYWFAKKFPQFCIVERI